MKVKVPCRWHSAQGTTQVAMFLRTSGLQRRKSGPGTKYCGTMYDGMYWYMREAAVASTSWSMEYVLLYRSLSGAAVPYSSTAMQRYSGTECSTGPSPWGLPRALALASLVTCHPLSASKFVSFSFSFSSSSSSSSSSHRESRKAALCSTAQGLSGSTSQMFICAALK